MVVDHDRALLRASARARSRLGQAARRSRAPRDQLPARTLDRALPDDAARVRRAAELSEPDQGSGPVDFSTGSVGIGATATHLERDRPPLRRRPLRRPAGRAPRRARGRRRARRGRDLGGARRSAGAAPRRSALDRRPEPAVARPGRAGHCGRRDLAAMFEAAGWQTHRRSSMAAGSRAVRPRPGGEALRRRIDSMSNEEYQRLLRSAAAEAPRPRSPGRLATAASIALLIGDLDDAELAPALPRPRRPRPRSCCSTRSGNRRGDRPAVGDLRLHDQGAGACRRRATPRIIRRFSSSEQWHAAGRELGATRASRGPRSPRAAPRPASAARGRAPRARSPVPGRSRRSRRDFGRGHSGSASTQQVFGRFFVDFARPAPTPRATWSRSPPMSLPPRTSAAGSTMPASGTWASASTGSPTTRRR